MMYDMHSKMIFWKEKRAGSGDYLPDIAPRDTIHFYPAQISPSVKFITLVTVKSAAYLCTTCQKPRYDHSVFGEDHSARYGHLERELMIKVVVTIGLLIAGLKVVFFTEGAFSIAASGAPAPVTQAAYNVITVVPSIRYMDCAS